MKRTPLLVADKTCFAKLGHAAPFGSNGVNVVPPRHQHHGGARFVNGLFSSTFNVLSRVFDVFCDFASRDDGELAQVVDGAARHNRLAIRALLAARAPREDAGADVRRRFS
jgi:hypothetical protein